jgi:hypothetical protein
MAHNPKVFLAALISSTLLSSGIVWAASSTMQDQQNTQNSMKETAQELRANKDFGKLSEEGSRAFRNVNLARIAIFEGQAEQAKKYVNDAERDFNKAKSDDTVFLKAEADLKQPSQMSQNSNEGRSVQSANSSVSPQGSNEKVPPQNYSFEQASDGQKNKPIAWLPVDGAITINEDYTASPGKSAAVADANKSLKSGNRKEAMEKLKLSGMDVELALGIVPLQYTLDHVQKAAQLIDDGKYYEGSQDLRQIAQAEHFDVIDISSTPKAANANSGQNSSGSNTPEMGKGSSNR